MAGTIAPVIAGLVAGAAFVVLFALHDFGARESIVIIPEGSSFDGSGKNFTPETITVMIGVNNTVVWVNEDTVPSTVVASDSGDPDFFKATVEPDFLMPGDEFRYTFTLPGEFEYHSEPHPWKQGKIIVLPDR